MCVYSKHFQILTNDDTLDKHPSGEGPGKERLGEKEVKIVIHVHIKITLRGGLLGSLFFALSIKILISLGLIH